MAKKRRYSKKRYSSSSSSRKSRSGGRSVQVVRLEVIPVQPSAGLSAQSLQTGLMNPPPPKKAQF